MDNLIKKTFKLYNGKFFIVFTISFIYMSLIPLSEGINSFYNEYVVLSGLILLPIALFSLTFLMQVLYLTFLFKDVKKLDSPSVREAFKGGITIKGLAKAANISAIKSFFILEVLVRAEGFDYIWRSKSNDYKYRIDIPEDLQAFAYKRYYWRS